MVVGVWRIVIGGRVGAWPCCCCAALVTQYKGLHMSTYTSTHAQSSIQVYTNTHTSIHTQVYTNAHMHVLPHHPMLAHHPHTHVFMRTPPAHISMHTSHTFPCTPPTHISNPPLPRQLFLCRGTNILPLSGSCHFPLFPGCSPARGVPCAACHCH